MESHIKIRATIPEISAFFREEPGVRHYEIRDKRYTEADINAMPDEVRNRERFTFFCVYRHRELEKPLSGTFTIASLKKRVAQEHDKESIIGKLHAPLPPAKAKKSQEREVR